VRPGVRRPGLAKAEAGAGAGPGAAQRRRLSIRDGQVDITITNPGKGEVTQDDVTFGRALAEAVTRYAAELEHLAARAATANPDDTAGQAA
jgi:hypothetical protein